MPGDYEGFPVTTIGPDGIQVSVGAGVDVHVRAEGEVADEAESPLTTDADGEIAAGTLAGLDAGDVVHFRVENYLGASDSCTQVLT